MGEAGSVLTVTADGDVRVVTDTDAHEVAGGGQLGGGYGTLG